MNSCLLVSQANNRLLITDYNFDRCSTLINVTSSLNIALLDQWLHARHGLLRLGIGTYSDVFVDDRLLCFYNARSNEIVEEVRVFIDDWEAPRGHFCSYDLKMKDIGTKNVTFLFRTSWRTDPPESFRLEHKVRVVPGKQCSSKPTNV